MCYELINVDFSLSEISTDGYIVIEKISGEGGRRISI